jgi:hypothetical protein
MNQPTTLTAAAQFALDNAGGHWVNDNGDRADLFLRVKTGNLTVLLRLRVVDGAGVIGTEVRKDSDDMMTEVLRQDCYQTHVIGWEFIKWVKVIAWDHRYFELATILEGK